MIDDDDDDDDGLIWIPGEGTWRHTFVLYDSSCHFALIASDILALVDSEWFLLPLWLLL